MWLSIKKLLTEYFSKEQVQDALRDIGESITGTKEELVNNLAIKWKTYNRDNYDLLEFIDEPELQMICYYYNLDASDTSEETYRRRIKKAKLLESSTKITTTSTPRPPAGDFNRPRKIDEDEMHKIEKNTSSRFSDETVKSTEKHDFIHSRKAWVIVAIIIPLFAVFYPGQIHDAIFPPRPSIIVDINAQNGIIETNNSSLQYQPRSIPGKGVIPETFFVNIMNRGNADAHNFTIELLIVPQSNTWFDYHDTKVVSQNLPPVCKAKTSQCEIDVVPKDGSIQLDYQVTIDLQQYQQIKSDHPKIIFKYKYDESGDNKKEVNIVLQ